MRASDTAASLGKSRGSAVVGNGRTDGHRACAVGVVLNDHQIFSRGPFNVPPLMVDALPATVDVFKMPPVIRVEVPKLIVRAWA